MSMRLHIDIDLGNDETVAKSISEGLIDTILQSIHKNMNDVDLNQFKWILCDDSDRGRRNYLRIDENGHATSKKCTVREDRPEFLF